MSDDFYIPASDEHKKRERKKARELRQSQWWKQLLGRGICYYCGENFTKEELTMDHKVPVSRGGKSQKGNVVVCCKACNTNKRHKTLAEMELEKLNSD